MKAIRVNGCSLEMGKLPIPLVYSHYPGPGPGPGQVQGRGTGLMGPNICVTPQRTGGKFQADLQL